MAARRGATFRRVQLGKELRRLRDNADLRMDQVAKKTGIPQSRLTRVEKGDIPLPRIRDLERLLDLYDVTDVDDRDFLIGVHKDSLSKEPWHTYRNVLPSGMHLFLGLEQDARGIKAWEQNFVFGLFQTEAYARSLFLSSKVVEERTTAYVEHNVRLRMERKEIVTRAEAPVELRVVLDEAALRRVVGDADVMREQYAEIEKLAGLDHVTVQVLPQALHTYRSMENFIMLEFEDASIGPVVTTETSRNMTLMDRETDIWEFTRRLDSLRESALAPAETPHLLQQLAREI